jgi:hypothetical protein
MDFPANPTIGQLYSLAGKTWEYNGEGWELVAAAAQEPIQFQDEGINLGAAGTVDTVDFVGSAVTAARVGDKVTVTINGGDAAVPYFVASAEAFEVALYRQALFTLPIEIDGTIEIDGYLVEVV